MPYPTALSERPDENAPYISIEKAALSYGVVDWLGNEEPKNIDGNSLLVIRKKVAAASRDFCRGVVWSLVLDSCISKLNDEGFKTQECAEDRVITISGEKHSELLRGATIRKGYGNTLKYRSLGCKNALFWAGAPRGGKGKYDLATPNSDTFGIQPEFLLNSGKQRILLNILYIIGLLDTKISWIRSHLLFWGSIGREYIIRIKRN